MSKRLHELVPPAKFRLALFDRGDIFELLAKGPGRATIRNLTPERVRLPNGKEFFRLKKPVDVSLQTEVEEVQASAKVSAAR